VSGRVARRQIGTSRRALRRNAAKRRVMRVTPACGEYFPLRPGGGEGRGEVGDCSAFADSHLTSHRFAAGPSSPP